ncbi:MAG: heme a synthase [Candidatus Eremiobacteraeota bacterium]|jgi:heme A synthase|nr:heme a synthase [Candidatus Eremiobacteraeota bacterium]
MFRAFSLAAAAAAFLLAVLGSWVRINDAGMTCPDWPLCHHALVPALGGGVVLEWSHRLLALVTGILVLPAMWFGWRARKRIGGVAAVLAFIGAVFVVQVALGGLTVALSNTPWSVVVHWGTAMLLLAGLTALALLAVVAPRRVVIRHSVLGGVLSAGAVLAFLTMLAGSFVSSSNAGLACTTLPACDGGSWTGTFAGQLAQMTHRWLALAFFAVATAAAYMAALGTTARVRTAALTAYALVVLQVMLGIANVAWQLPTVLREAHAANACAAFVAFVASLAFAAIDGTVPVAARAAQPHRIARSQPHAEPLEELAR